MEVDLLPDQKVARVTFTYQLEQEGGSISLPLRMIGFRKGEIQNVRVETDTGFDSVLLKAKDHNVAVGQIELSSAQSQDSLATLVLSYELPFSNRMTIPILLVDTEIVAARQASFQAQIKVPNDYAIRSVFPAMRWKANQRKEGKVYQFEMQAIPAWIKFRVFEGKAPFWSLERVIDWGIILLLVGLIAFGWKLFKTQKK